MSNLILFTVSDEIIYCWCILARNRNEMYKRICLFWWYHYLPCMYIIISLLTIFQPLHSLSAMHLACRDNDKCPVLGTLFQCATLHKRFQPNCSSKLKPGTLNIEQIHTNVRTTCWAQHPACWAQVDVCSMVWQPLSFSLAMFPLRTAAGIYDSVVLTASLSLCQICS